MSYLDATIRQGETPALIAVIVNGLVDVEHECEVVPTIAHLNREYHRALGSKGFTFHKEAFAALAP